MMKTVFGSLLIIGAMVFPAVAEEPALSGEEIKVALSDRTAFYDDGTKQFFNATGATNYYDVNGVRDDGFWEVRKDQYCSWWERGGWACYDVTGQVPVEDGARITFIAPNAGTTYPGYTVAGDKAVD